MTRRGSHVIARICSLLVGVLLIEGLLTVLAPEAGALPGARCRVTNLTTMHVYVGTGPNLQRAIARAVGGTSLRVRGVCAGNFSIAKRLALVGWKTAAFPTPTLNGDGAGTVLTIKAGTVVVRDITITGGNATQYFGGGIDNESRVTLSGATSVSGNTGDFGSGGVFNEGTLWMNGHASVSGNSTDAGGGIYNEGSLRMSGHASVWGNTAQFGGGIYSNFGGILLQDHASVSGNTTTSYGGGIVNIGSLTMDGASTVSDNTATGDGGGVMNADLAHLTMKHHASVAGNTSSGRGGGIFESIFAHLRHAIDGVNVRSNVPDNIFFEEK